MSATVHRGAVVLFLALCAACRSSVPTSPTGMSPSPNGSFPLPGLTQPSVTPQPNVIPPTSLPPLSGPSRTFVFERADYRVAEYTERSRFILYDNGAFSLQYPSLSGNLSPYRGSYTEENGVMDFTWERSNNSNPPDATGTLQGDSLKIEYSLNMRMSDFEDAVYALMR